MVGLERRARFRCVNRHLRFDRPAEREL